MAGEVDDDNHFLMLWLLLLQGKSGLEIDVPETHLRSVTNFVRNYLYCATWLSYILSKTL